MKCRNGFVSNSSTTSFLIVGVEVPWAKMVQMQAEAGVPMPAGRWSDDSMYAWVEGWRSRVGEHFDCDVQGYPEATQRIGVMVDEGEGVSEVEDPGSVIAEALIRAEQIRARLGLDGPVNLYYGEYSTEEY